MQPAQDRLAPLLAVLPFAEAAFPVLPNVTATPEQSGAALREALVRQVTGAVRWVETVEAMREQFAPASWIEVGPGKVLSGLLRQIDRAQCGLNVEDAASLGSTLSSLTVTA